MKKLNQYSFLTVFLSLFLIQPILAQTDSATFRKEYVVKLYDEKVRKVFLHEINDTTIVVKNYSTYNENAVATIQTIPYTDIKAMNIYKNGSGIKGALFGGLGGLAIGWIPGAIYEKKNGKTSFGWGLPSPLQSPIMGSVVGFFSGMFIGAGIALITQKQFTINGQKNMYEKMLGEMKGKLQKAGYATNF